ncbi:MAG: RHS repeat-associated core domain-containing protein [Terriglobales bacterium]
MGRADFSGEATPDSGGWYQVEAAHFFNGALETLQILNNSGGNLLPGAVYYELDGEGRPGQVSDASGGLVNSAVHAPLGLQTMTYASTDSHTDTDSYAYASGTGRMTSYSYAVDGYADSGAYDWLTNGEVGSFSVADSIPGTADNNFGCTYGHDDMGRLSAANCGAASTQTFTFDPFGNVCKTATSGTNFCPAYNLYNEDESATYNSDGDTTTDPVSGATNTFDAEGRPTSFLGAAVVYDAMDRAVEAGGQEFVYGAGGSKIAVMDGQTLVRADISLPGGAEAVFNGAGLAYYRHADRLGSSPLATTQAGALYSEAAFAPYGEPLLEAGTQDRSFTGMKQDIANGSAPSSDGNGQYGFLAREYSPTQGRWWTPDPSGLAAVDPEDPQSWNRYAYGCDPLGTRDATGSADTCTLAVNLLNYSSATAGDLTAIENRVNSIYAATPTSAGNDTQIDFVSSGAAYTLNLFAEKFSGTSGVSLVQGEAYQGGADGWVFMTNAAYYAGLGARPGAADTVAGTDAAHELVHEITGTDDLPFTQFNEQLMSIDSVQLGDIQARNDVYNDWTGALPTGFSKLSPAEADALYDDCIQMKLRPPAASHSGGGAGGGGFAGGWRYSETWSCGSEGCEPSGWLLWYDSGGLIPLGVIDPWAKSTTETAYWPPSGSPLALAADFVRYGSTATTLPALALKGRRGMLECAARDRRRLFASVGGRGGGPTAPGRSPDDRRT